jgi:hypothetical protein
MGYQNELIMKYLLFILLLGCGTSKPIPQPIPVVIHDTVHVTVTQIDTQRITRYFHDTAHQVLGEVSIIDFGAIAGGFDNANVFDSAIAWAITHPCVITMPVGAFYTSRPWLWQNIQNGTNRFFTIHLKGQMNNKSSSDEYLTKIIYTGKSGYAIGIQRGRSIVIENITILGQYNFPNYVNNYNIGILHFSDWIDPTITDTRNNPYAAISIDPNQNIDGSRGGTSDVTIKNCSIKNWMVGIVLSPNGVTQNDEMINILEDDIESVRICVAIGQDQSKTVNIKGLKVWSSVYTVVDGLNYGSGTGGGSVFCENWNIAGNCKELFNLSTGRFPLSCKDIYSESLYRIGYVGSGVGANFINTEIDFLSGPGMPEADYLIQGQANFYGGMLRYYDGDGGHRLNFATIGFIRIGFMFRDMTISNLPITQGLYGIPTNYWYSPRFDNTIEYFSGWDMSQKKDTLIIVSMANLVIDRTKWTGSANISWITPAVNDYLLAEPTSTTATYYDGVGYCTTKVLGRVTSVSGNTVTLDHVSINAYSGNNYGRIYIDRIK